MYRNQAAFSTASAARAYGRGCGLTPAETAALALCRTSGATLDLGVGGGRTTAALAPPARLYVGVDYASRMVAACRSRFRGLAQARFIEADAASLPGLEAAAFDLVLFSYNGLDYVAHPHRLRVLAEVRRLLAPAGRFVFSTHNRAYPAFRRRPALARPLRLRGLARFALEWGNRLRHGRAEREEDGHALINDSAHRFGLVTYAIRREDQVRQLEAAGFRVLAVLAPDGAAAGPEADLTAASLHFVAGPAA